MIRYAINRHGQEGWRRTVLRMLGTADYAVKRFNERGTNAWRHRNSPTVVYARPPRTVFDGWQIAPEGDEAHIVTMPHVHHNTIDRLVEDCTNPMAQGQPDSQDTSVRTPILGEAPGATTIPAAGVAMPRIVIMAENRIGTIASIAGILAEGGVNLNSIATEN